jgi:hypothetical protein
MASQNSLGRGWVGAQWLTVVLLSISCTTIRLVSDYDEPTDKALTSIQKSTEEFITTLAANAPSDANALEKHNAFYADIDQQLRQLEFRVNAIPGNGHTVKLVKDIRAVILGERKCTTEGASLRDLHCLPENAAQGPSKKTLEIQQRNINQAITAALALELAKKQGHDAEK